MADQAPKTPEALALSLTQQALGGTRRSKLALDEELLKSVDDSEKAINTNGGVSLYKKIEEVLNGPNRHSIERLAFEEDPTQKNEWQGIYKPKRRLLPDAICKRISIQDDLVAAIVWGRSCQVARCGRPRPDRFSLGFVVEPKKGLLEKADDQEKERLGDCVRRLIHLIQHCGKTDGWGDQDKMSFSQFLQQQTRNAVVVGRMATECIYTIDPADGKKKFHSFRPIDAGTIYKAASGDECVEVIRAQSKRLREQLNSKPAERYQSRLRGGGLVKIDEQGFIEGKYEWVQVIDGRPVQAFTSAECKVYNFYPVTDVELGGYPVTPLDTAISAVTTHLNITQHNKLFFQTGRAARGILIIKSDDIDPTVVSRARQQFNASINSVNNSWRLPVFGIGSNDNISFQPIESGTRDMEFQYMADSNARVILSAFQMSPEELPGWAYLSRGTTNQALSESNNEYQLEAHRDLGIRPTLKHHEDNMNGTLLPLMDEEAAKVCEFRFAGLDSDTAEKEAVRLQQDAGLHLTYNEILDKVEKRPVDKKLGGDFPLNPQYQAVLDKYCTVGQVIEYYMGVEGASKDPSLAYRRDSFWFQWQQMRQEAQMAQQQAQQQQGAGGQPQPGPGGGGGGGQSAGPPPAQSSGASDNGQGRPQEKDVPTEKEKTESSQDLTRSLDAAQAAVLGKSELQLPPSKRRLLTHQRLLVERVRSGFERGADEAIPGIMKEVGPLLRRRK